MLHDAHATRNRKPVQEKTRRAIQFPGLLTAADRLGVHRNHLYLVLSGKRTSKSLLARYHKLKTLAVGLLLVWAASAPGAPIPTEQAVRAIVGEAANQGRAGMLAVAGAIRNRGTLRGVYGLKNPVADQQPAWVWERARAAWAMSATNDISRGATHWENCRAFGTPRWASSMTVTTNVGAHTFMKEAK